MSNLSTVLDDAGDADRNIVIFYCYRIISRFYFHLPVLFLHLYTVEMGFDRVILILTVYGLTTTFTANLNGLLAPYLRLKVMVAFGEVLKGIGILLVIVGTEIGHTEFWTVLIGQVIGGAGFSLAISSDGGLLRAITAGERNAGELFARTQARSQSLMFLATLFAGCIGSVLYAYEAHWPFYASLFANALAVTAISLVHENRRIEPRSMNAGAPKTSDKTYLDGKQKFWMNFYAVSRAYTLAPFIGFLPFYFISIDLDQYFFGSILGIFSICAFFSALFANEFLKYFGLRSLMAVTVGCTVGAILLFSMCDQLAIRGIDYFETGLVAIALLGIGSGGVRPVTMANISLDKIPPEHRTIVLSKMERNFGIINSFMLCIGGYIMYNYTFVDLMIFLICLYGVLMLCLFMLL